MSFTIDTIASSPSFEEVFDAALVEYTKETGVDLAKHPLVAELENKSPDDIVLVLEGQAKAHRDGNKRFIEPIVSVLCALSSAFGECTGPALPPATAIFGGIRILLMTVKKASSYDSLIDLFDCIANFLKRLRIHKSFSHGMAEIAVKIMAEVLSALALATKQLQMGRFAKFGTKLLGEDKIAAVLCRLDRLTQEEALMTVAQTLEVVQGLVSTVKVAMSEGRVSIEGFTRALVAMQQTIEKSNKLQRDQLRMKVRKWLSPPDPAINHDAACSYRARHPRTARWLVEGRTFSQWRTSGSMLWINGKPGSGKTVLCSRIIEDLEDMHRSGLASVIFFYFDFKDIKKQSRRALLSSILVQLCVRSDLFYDVLSRLYSTHDYGARQPSDDSLMQCLREMLLLPGQCPLYIVMDAPDECPNNIGWPSPREELLLFIKELVGLRRPDLHLCITSRPEADIRATLGPLTSHPVSLHEESGQREDIINYIVSVVHSDRIMRKWRDEDKQLVIDVLSTKANGMFRWVYCQLETLRRCLRPSIQRILNQLPATLDETYARALLGIDEEKWEYAKRIFQCLTVSVRPLRAEELAEAIVVDFDTEAAPRLDAGWRPADPEEAILSTCSSLITITEIDGSRVVQYSHFSVKEFLVSSRLATSPENISRYHIQPLPAHTLFAKLCLGVLLQFDERVNKSSIKKIPLAEYAAQHWVEHARFEDVSSHVQQELESLFDPEKPHFSAWVRVHDIDPSRSSMVDTHPTTPDASPLHYAVLSGLLDLVKRLAALRPNEIHGRDESNRTPLHAALHGDHTGVARFLVDSGASTDVQDDNDWSPLHAASQNGNFEIVRLLLERGADVNAQTRGHHQAPLDLALRNGPGNIEVVRSLLEHGANVNTRDDNDLTPLHIAFQRKDLEATELLLDSRAIVNARRRDRQTPLHLAVWEGEVEFTRVYLERGADVSARGDRGKTPLQRALGNGALGEEKIEIVRLLLKHKGDQAIVNVRGDWNDTPLHFASENGQLEIMSLLLEHGADVNARDSRDRTPLHLALGSAKPGEVIRALLEHKADVNAKDNHGKTPLHMASKSGKAEIVRQLLEQSANVDTCSEQGLTALHEASATGHLEIVRLLLKHGADTKARTKEGTTALHMASMGGWLEVVRLLVGRGADVDAKDEGHWTPLHFSLEYNSHEPEVALWLFERGANVHARDKSNRTPFQLALERGYFGFNHRKERVGGGVVDHKGPLEGNGSRTSEVVGGTVGSWMFTVAPFS